MVPHTEPDPPVRIDGTALPAAVEEEAFGP